MVSLARASLLYEWRRFLPAVLAVAFAGLLVLVQLGLLLGMFSSISVYIDASRADLWVGYPGTQSVDLARAIPGKVENRLRMHPQVAAVERFTWMGADWRRPDGAKLSAVLIGVEPKPGSMTFARLLTPELRQKLLMPGGVVVDEAELEKLGVRVGDSAELNRQRVTVVGVLRGMRAMGGANVLSSLATARSIEPELRGEATDYFLVRLRDPAQAERVRDELQPISRFRPYQVWTAEEFSIQSQGYWLFESGAGAGFLFSSALGLLVGVVITSQTLMAAILAALREYATLRALGVSGAALRAVVLEQSLWVGLAGLSLTGLLGYGLAEAARAADVALSLPSWAALSTGLLVLLIALGSGLAALRALNQAEPASLLR
ncbi:MAG: ABC transporter permease [Gammaproteobacteria bacterium]|nr:ABC transporter permease [Gammaproteobacteria bacterium]